MPISKRLLKKIRGNHPDLKTVDLSHKILDLRDVRKLTSALKENLTITEIDLSKTQIGDEGAKILAEYLQDNHYIKRLDLYQALIHDEGMIALAKSLESNSALTSINLTGHYPTGYYGGFEWYQPDNRIGTQGAKALAKAIEVNSSLTEVMFCYNPIWEEGEAALEKAIEKNPYITWFALTLLFANSPRSDLIHRYEERNESIDKTCKEAKKTYDKACAEADNNNYVTDKIKSECSSAMKAIHQGVTLGHQPSISLHKQFELLLKRSNYQIHSCLKNNGMFSNENARKESLFKAKTEGRDSYRSFAISKFKRH